MSDALSRLEEISTRLNSSSDTLTEAIKNAEAKLASLRLGVAAWLEEPINIEQEFNEKGELEDQYITRFGYTKCNGAWHLALMEDSERWGGIEESGWPKITPLQQAPRELRVKALQKLPALLGTLTAKAIAALQEVDKALYVAQTWLD